jgi:PIN domain
VGRSRTRVFPSTRSDAHLSGILRAMIVLLDTTVLTSDPTCAGNAWRVLVLAAPAWGIKIALTEVVVAEAVANYERELKEVRAALAGWAEKKRLGALGLREAFTAADEVLSVADAHYHERLDETLRASNVNVLPIANFPHTEIIKRATARTRPCNDKGDGYRDTLNWLTLLALAKDQPKEEIIWVSGNTADFGSGSGEDKAALHPHLIEDLDSISASERVSWDLSLADTVLALAAKYAPGTEEDIKQVQEKVRNDSVLEFLAMELLVPALQQSISAQDCGLPLETISASLRFVGGIRNLKLTVKGIISDERALAEFTVEVDAGIDVTLALPSDTLDAEIITSARYINKPLLLRGLVTLDRFERPVGAELAQIESFPDDPGRTQWQTQFQAAPEITLQIGQAARWLRENEEAIRQMREAARPFQENQEIIRQMSEVRQWLRENEEAIRQMREATGYFRPGNNETEPNADDDTDSS